MVAVLNAFFQLSIVCAHHAADVVVQAVVVIEVAVTHKQNPRRVAHLRLTDHRCSCVRGEMNCCQAAYTQQEHEFSKCFAYCVVVEIEMIFHFGYL